MPGIRLKKWILNDKIAETASMLQVFAVENLAAALNAGGYDEGVAP